MTPGFPNTKNKDVWKWRRHTHRSGSSPSWGILPRLVILRSHDPFPEENEQHQLFISACVCPVYVNSHVTCLFRRIHMDGDYSDFFRAKTFIWTEMVFIWKPWCVRVDGARENESVLWDLSHLSLSDSNLCSTQINNKVKAISHQHPTHTFRSKPIFTFVLQISPK